MPVARIHELTLQVSISGDLGDQFDAIEPHFRPELNGGQDLDRMIHKQVIRATEHFLGHLNKDLAKSGLTYTIKD
jgi:hypothetical protein